jgi:hypothetical protein
MSLAFESVRPIHRGIKAEDAKRSSLEKKNESTIE